MSAAELLALMAGVGIGAANVFLWERTTSSAKVHAEPDSEMTPEIAARLTEMFSRDRSKLALPPASADQERSAMAVVGDWREIAPDEWVARYIHMFPLWGWADYRFPNPEFEAWLGEVEVYVFDFAGRDALRRKYLTEEERLAAIAYEWNPW
jgi:hypothetical protein